jgi:hypothetical protein
VNNVNRFLPMEVRSTSSASLAWHGIALHGRDRDMRSALAGDADARRIVGNRELGPGK